MIWCVYNKRKALSPVMRESASFFFIGTPSKVARNDNNLRGLVLELAEVVFPGNK